MKTLLNHDLLTTAVEPPDFKCIACAMSDNFGAYFKQHVRTDTSDPLIPLLYVVVDVWGPFGCGDRDGFRFMFGGIVKATGKVFFQPMRKKSDTRDAMETYVMAHIAADCPSI